MGDCSLSQRDYTFIIADKTRGEECTAELSRRDNVIVTTNKIHREECTAELSRRDNIIVTTDEVRGEKVRDGICADRYSTRLTYICDL